MFRKGHRHPLLSRNLFPDGGAQVTKCGSSEGCRRSPQALAGDARPALHGFPLGRVPESLSFVLCLSGLEGLCLRTSLSHEGMGINLPLTRNTADGHPLRQLGSLCDSLSLQDEYPWTHRGLGVTLRLPRVALPPH